MKLTVAICTWNRAMLLRRALASHVDAHVPAGVEREILVVDNGSTDETPGVVNEFAARLPVRRVSEPTPGLSHARNAAIDAATGDYVLWTDDDVLVPRSWMTSYAEAVARWPDAAVFGGPIHPFFDAPPPRWLARALPVVANAFALLDLGELPVPLSDAVVPFGANYMVRVAEQRTHRYSPRLGRVRDNLAGGEETAVVRAILADGGTGWYLPSPAVHHVLPHQRLTVRYLRRYYFAQNASLAHVPGFPLIFGRPRWAYRVAIEHELRYWVTRAFGTPERWVHHLRRASEGWGLLHAASPIGRPDEWRPALAVAADAVSVDPVPPDAAPPAAGARSTSLPEQP